MRALSVPVPRVTVWINHALIIQLMVNACLKIVRQILQPLVVVVRSDILLAGMPAKNVATIHALPDMQNQLQPNVMILPQMNVELLVIRQKIAILVLDIMNVAVHGNIVRAQLVRPIVPVVVFIAKAITSLIDVIVIMDRVMGIIEADIVLFLVMR